MVTNEPPPTEAMLDGRYLLGECVGQGGMARVHRAEDVLLGRTVAVKLLRPELEGASTSSRARSEMTVLASLNHPALVTLYDAQLAPGRAEYLVMEFVDGPTLAARLAGGPLPARQAAVLVADLAEALHVVHDAGIVHRDIKPSNVLMAPVPPLGDRSGAKLADFGISVLVDAARLTQPGTVVGTAAYLAPEQLTGAPPAPPSDIYALGLVALEALTGRRGFPSAEGFGEALARLTVAPEIPDTLDPAWAALLRDMTAMDPDDRPSAAEVFAAARALAERPAAPALPPVPAAVAAATPPATAATTTRVLPAAAPGQTTAVAARRRPSRARAGLVGGLAAAALAATAIGGMWLAGSTGEPAPRTPADTEQSAVPEPAPAETTEQVTVVDEQTGGPDEQPAAPVEDTTTQDGPQSEADRKAAEDAAKKAEREAEKAADEQKKAEQRENKRDQDKPGQDKPGRD
ncbi:serine/threonine-protein kinase [Microbacterium sp. 2P01SA-2]|uniref:serine/threonine-protein kinase n=1 Tax=unclassified Microbacterium TaxID=2609290 RepID=UPI00399F06BB